MLTPRFIKYKKTYKLKIKTKKKTLQIYNSIALKSTKLGFLDYKNIETLRRLIVKKVGKNSKILFRIFLNLPLTKKSLSSRMGKGKGAHSNFIVRVPPGMIILEFIPFVKCNIILKKLVKELQLKLPFSVKILNYNE